MVGSQVREDVVLRDGSTLRLRPTGAADDAALLAFFERLSPESRHLRFQGGVRIGASTVAPFLRSDGKEALSLVAELAVADGGPRIVALGTFVRLRDASRARVDSRRRR